MKHHELVAIIAAHIGILTTWVAFLTVLVRWLS